VPAAAVIQNPQALSGFIGRKVFVGGLESLALNTSGLTRGMNRKLPDLKMLGAIGTHGVGVKSVDIVRNTKSEGR
jgi:hypothetical protein